MVETPAVGRQLTDADFVARRDQKYRNTWIASHPDANTVVRMINENLTASYKGDGVAPQLSEKQAEAVRTAYDKSYSYNPFQTLGSRFQATIAAVNADRGLGFNAPVAPAVANSEMSGDDIKKLEALRELRGQAVLSDTQRADLAKLEDARLKKLEGQTSFKDGEAAELKQLKDAKRYAELSAKGNLEGKEVSEIEGLEKARLAKLLELSDAKKLHQPQDIADLKAIGNPELARLKREKQTPQIKEQINKLEAALATVAAPVVPTAAAPVVPAAAPKAAAPVATRPDAAPVAPTAVAPARAPYSPMVTKATAAEAQRLKEAQVPGARKLTGDLPEGAAPLDDAGKKKLALAATKIDNKTTSPLERRQYQEGLKTKLDDDKKYAEVAAQLKATTGKIYTKEQITKALSDGYNGPVTATVAQLVDKDAAPKQAPVPVAAARAPVARAPEPVSAPRS